MKRQTARAIIRYGAAALNMAGLAWSAPAIAFDWNLTGGVEAQHDDNLFRKIDADRTSDNIFSATAGLSLQLAEKNLLAQLEGEVDRTWFDRNGFLDNVGYSLAARAERPKGRITFDLNASRQRHLSDFAEIYSNTRNMQALTLIDGETRIALLGDFRLVAGGSFTQTENSSVFAAGYRNGGIRAGFGYYSPTGNYVAVTFQHARSRGAGGQSIDLDGEQLIYRQRFDEDRLAAKVHYGPSALVLLDGEIAYVKRDDKSLFRKNFDGIIGELSLIWKPRRTIDVATRIGRQLQSDGYIYSDSVRQNYADISMVAKATNQLQFSTSIAYIRQRFVYDVQAPIAIAPRTDRISRIKGEISYKIGNSIKILIDAKHELRNSTNDIFKYKENYVGLTIKLNTRDSIKSLYR
jgi:hypothetical protein